MKKFLAGGFITTAYGIVIFAYFKGNYSAVFGWLCAIAFCILWFVNSKGAKE